MNWWHALFEFDAIVGVIVENGRIADTAGLRLRSALREVVETIRPQVRLTAQQNVIFADVAREHRSTVDAILDRHGVERAAAVHPVRRLSMACPAIPTCGLAVAESERVLPSLIRDIETLVDEVGLSDSPISVRMTGCPNGCARPYLGDVGLVGTTLGKYDVFLGGDPGGTRLNQLYAFAVPLESICGLLRPVLRSFAAEREGAEAFGEWCHRTGIEALHRRFAEPDMVMREVAVAAGHA